MLSYYKCGEQDITIGLVKWWNIPQSRIEQIGRSQEISVSNSVSPVKEGYSIFQRPRGRYGYLKIFLFRGTIVPAKKSRLLPLN
jgi:hypothetical protein